MTLSNPAVCKMTVAGALIIALIKGLPYKDSTFLQTFVSTAIAT